MLNKLLKAEWLIFAGVWLVGALWSKRTVRREPIFSRLGYGLLLGFAFLLIYQPWRLRALDLSIISNNALAAKIGVVLTGIGLAFAIWARLTLGSNWSGTVTIKENHQLILQGPYRIVRHPIYSGILLAAAGTVIKYGWLPSLLALPMVFLALWGKSRVEERFMTETFGQQYEEYKKQVKGGLIPGLL